MNAEYHKVRNRETLRKLDNGMEITRATKHEPMKFDNLARVRLQELTDDCNGSKFLETWPIERVVEWTAGQVKMHGWQFPPGAQARVHAAVNEPVGYVCGQLVSTITVKVSGRWVHAYPDEDQR